MLKIFRSMILCFLIIVCLTSCSEHRDVNINIPEIKKETSSASSRPVENIDDTIDASSSDEDIDNGNTGIILHEPVFIEDCDDIIIDNADFLGIKINDEKYAVYTLNGVFFGSFNVVLGEDYLLRMYDFGEFPVMLFNGELSVFRSSNEYQMKNIIRIDNRQPVSIDQIMDTCSYIPDISRNTKHKFGLWHGIRYGKDYIITSINDKFENRSYYFAISDESFSLYSRWSDVLSHFV